MVKRRILAIALGFAPSLLCVAGTAAADLELARSSYIAILPYDWSGFYLGGTLGATWARTQFNTEAVANAAYADARTIGVIDELGTGMPLGNHIVGSFQLGWNWQFAPRWLVGAEFDINSVAEKLSQEGSARAPATRVPPPALGATPIIGLTNNLNARWLATTRARLGATFNNQNSVLLYVTGGAAFTAMSYSQTFSISSTNVADYSVSQSQGTSSARYTKIGWTAGAGTEWILSSAWTARVEYLYVQFRGQNMTTEVCSAGLGCAQTLFGSTDPLRVQIARFGANYRFGGSGGVVEN